jgi:type II restriction enzyme
MVRNKLIDFIFNISNKHNAFEILEKRLKGTTKKQVQKRLIECGVLPEIFNHDSSEEKLWAKYSDILLSLSLNFLGIPSEVIRIRGDSADVLGKTSSYSIVGDVKTFRLSRTAKNQKDFKIKALDDWRRTNDFALLVCPLSQFPSNKSQIYVQAIERNVTLLSYVHLTFLLAFLSGKSNIRKLWETGRRLSQALPESEQKKAQSYWAEIDSVVCEILNKTSHDLKVFKEAEKQKRKELGLEGIRYWENKIEEYKSLSKEEAIRKLIKADKIEAKIEQIRRAINRECIR